MPPEFGGTDDVRNLVYVPPFVVDLKHDRRERDRAADPRRPVRSYAATPSTTGQLRPASIEIRASDPGEFQTTLRIWGPGLADG